MRVLLSDPPPPSFERLLEERRRTGADRFDEVWNGVLVMAPASRSRHADLIGQIAEVIGPLARRAGLAPMGAGFNLGEPDDYRIPDLGVLRERVDALYLSSAAIAIEVVSPNDDTWRKFDFYAAHRVEELLIVDPQTGTVQWFALDGSAYASTERSGLIDIGASELAEHLDWPPVADD